MGEKGVRFGALLLARGLLDQEGLDKALQHQKRTGKRLGEALVELGLLGEEAVRWGLAEQIDIPLVQPDPAALDPDALALVPSELCRRYGVLPLHLSFDVPGAEPVLTLAAADPTLKPVLDDLAQRIGRPMRIAAALREDIEAALDALYGPAPRGDTHVRAGDLPAERLEGALRDPTGTGLLNELLEWAVSRQEEVLHFRVADGECRVSDARGAVLFAGGEAWHAILLDRLRQMACAAADRDGVHRAAQRILQKGRVAHQTRDSGHTVLFRVSILRGLAGEEAQVRLMRPEGMPRALGDLGLTAHQCLEVRQALAKPGLVWVTASGEGGLGSTLFGLLREVSGTGRTITIEEEVFYRTPEFLQLETLNLGPGGRSEVLRELKHLDFERVMLDRASPAQLPDLLALAARRRWVFAGAPEASLEETLASLAARASDTPLYGLALVIHQKLLGVLCPKCRIASALGTVERHAVAQMVAGNQVVYQEGRGCEECGGRGTKGYRAFYELLPVDVSVREALYGESKGERRIPALLARVQPTIRGQVGEAVARGEISVSDLWEVF